MDSTARATIVGAAAVSAIALLLFWLTLPDSEPVRRVTPRAAEVAAAPKAAPAMRAAPPRPAKVPTKAPARSAKASPARALAKELQASGAQGGAVPEDLAAMLDEVRSERVADSEAKVAAYAQRAGWSEDTTSKVQGLIAEAYDRVDVVVAEATAGERPWTEVKAEVRQIRVDQAKSVRDALGDEEFAGFARAMAKARGKGRQR
jgi:hypothetical protein